MPWPTAYTSKKSYQSTAATQSWTKTVLNAPPYQKIEHSRTEAWGTMEAEEPVLAMLTTDRAPKIHGGALDAFQGCLLYSTRTPEVNLSSTISVWELTAWKSFEIERG
jgi:hypothetical protein